MNRAAIRTLLSLFLTTMTVSPARAQTEAGTVAAVVGKLQVQRAAAWQDAAVGAPVLVGDRLRTGDADQAKIVFRDESVLDLAPKTEISLDRQVFEPDVHRFQSQLHLITGKIRAWVSDYYHEPRAHYEVETPTAIAGVRGTEFIARYDGISESTDIVGVADTVEVSGKLAVMGAAVQVGPRFYVSVQKGRFPTAPERLDDVLFQQYLDGLDIIGTGRRDGLNVQHPAVAGRLLAAQDVPTALGGRVEVAPAERLSVGAPPEFLAARLSPDVYTNMQPLLDFEHTPAGQGPSGGVKVGF